MSAERAKVPGMGTGADGRAGMRSADPRAGSPDPREGEQGRMGSSQWGGCFREGRGQLTVIHQGKRDLVLGFSILELGGVRPLVILRQLLDDHLH